MEIWKSIKNCKGYEASNYGNIKSLSRIILRNGKYPILSKEKILKPSLNTRGYLIVNICINSKSKTRTVHQLVAIAFLNHVPCGYKLVVNHIDFNRINNNVENLEIVTSRENNNLKHIKNTSIYTGVCWNKKEKKWSAQIFINKRKKHLGYFKKEYDGHIAYEYALKIMGKC